MFSINFIHSITSKESIIDGGSSHLRSSLFFLCSTSITYLMGECSNFVTILADEAARATYLVCSPG